MRTVILLVAALAVLPSATPMRVPMVLGAQHIPKAATIAPFIHMKNAEPISWGSDIAIATRSSRAGRPYSVAHRARRRPSRCSAVIAASLATSRTMWRHF